MKSIVKRWQFELLALLCMTIVSIASYQVGHMSALNKEVIKLRQDADITDAISDNQTTEVSPTPVRDQRVVASKSSKSKLYHYSWCSGAKRIADKNKLWFASAASAEQAGYTLASNCQ